MGEINYPIASAANIVSSVPGDIVECGVYRGSTFGTLVDIATDHGRHAWGFDSFDGMGDPGPYDGTRYPRGRFKTSAHEVARSLVASGRDPEDWTLVDGWLPDSWSWFPGDRAIALAYVDIDHYRPTIELLPLIWSRISLGGVMVCDDYLPEMHPDQLATRAILQWMAINEITEGERFGREVTFVKP